MDTTTYPQEAYTPTVTAGAREAFIQKTYNHLLGAVVLFALVEVLLFQSGIAAAIAGVLASNWLITLGGFMLVSWLASRFAGNAQSLGKQYLGLGLFILAEAVIFVPLLVIAVYYSDPSVLTYSIYTTIGGFGILTAIVGFTKKDFSFLRPFLMVLGIAALVAIVAATIFNVNLGFYFSLAMVVFACGAILHDTSNVMQNFREDQYVAGALQLFASVALLFYYVLSIFIDRR